MRPQVWPALVLLPLVVGAGGCRDRMFAHESGIVVVNQSSCTLTAFVDGWEAFTVRKDSSRTVDNVGSGRHVLEAKDDLGRLVERRYIELHSGEDYYWRLEACAPR